MRLRNMVFTTLIVLMLVTGTVAGVMAEGDKPDTPTAFVEGPVPPFAWQRFDAIYYQPQNRVYFLGGRPAGADSTDPSVWMFDPAAGVYTDTLTDMPVAVSNHHIVQLTDATGPGLFIFGGFTTVTTFATEVQVYRPDTNSAAIVAGDTYSSTSTTPTAGCATFPGTAIAYNNKAYIMGGGALSGCAEPSVTDKLWIYDPMAPAGSRFTAGPPLTVARAYLQSAIIDNYLYAFGGDEVPGGVLTVTPIAERLDLTNIAGGWDDASVADMPVVPTSGVAGCDESQAWGFNTGSAVELAGKLVVASCGQWSSEFSESFTYDQAGNTWAPFDPVNLAVRNHAGALEVNGLTVRIWTFGGRAGADVGTARSEYRVLAVSPTPVKLSSLDGRSSPELPLLPLGLAALALATTAGLMRVARRRAAY